MNAENTKKLFERFEFFHPEAPITENLMAFGFECGDGWFKLIWDLCENIEKELIKEEENLDPKEKTVNLLRDAYRFRVTQVKEKYGSLRFYVGSATDKIFKLIKKAEDKSCTTCEVCGTDAKLAQRDGWYATLCIDCAKKNNYELGREE